MRRSRLQFLQRMADWNLRSCNGMLVKSGWVVCWQPKDHNHNTSIWNIICSKHQSLFTQTVGFYWTEAFPFPNAWNISMPWSHLSHALVAGTGQSTAHSWLLWMFIFENYADPSLDRHRRLIGATDARLQTHRAPEPPTHIVPCFDRPSTPRKWSILARTPDTPHGMGPRLWPNQPNLDTRMGLPPMQQHDHTRKSCNATCWPGAALSNPRPTKFGRRPSAKWTRLGLQQRIPTSHPTVRTYATT